MKDLIKEIVKIADPKRAYRAKVKEKRDMEKFANSFHRIKFSPITVVKEYGEAVSYF